MDNIKNDEELTSTMGNVLSTSKEEKNDSSDATPTSSTDANTNPAASQTVSDDPISSTSSEDPSKMPDMKQPSGDQCLKSHTEDHVGDLLDMQGSTEKITEDVEDLVHDLESLLGDTSSSLGVSAQRKTTGEGDASTRDVIQNASVEEGVESIQTKEDDKLNNLPENSETARDDSDDTNLATDTPTTESTCTNEQSNISKIILSKTEETLGSEKETDKNELSEELKQCNEDDQRSSETLVEAEPVVDHSAIAESVVEQSAIAESDVEQSAIVESDFEQSAIVESDVEQSAIAESDVEQAAVAESDVEQSAVAESVVEQSTITESEVDQSTITESEVDQSTITESEVDQSTQTKSGDEPTGAAESENPSVEDADSIGSWEIIDVAEAESVVSSTPGPSGEPILSPVSHNTADDISSSGDKAPTTEVNQEGEENREAESLQTENIQIESIQSESLQVEGSQSEANTSEHKETSNDNVSSVVQEMEEQTTQCEDNINDNVNENLEETREAESVESGAAMCTDSEQKIEIASLNTDEECQSMKSPIEITSSEVNSDLEQAEKETRDKNDDFEQASVVDDTEREEASIPLEVETSIDNEKNEDFEQASVVDDTEKEEAPIPLEVETSIDNEKNDDFEQASVVDDTEREEASIPLEVETSIDNEKNEDFEQASVVDDTEKEEAPIPLEVETSIDNEKNDDFEQASVVDDTEREEAPIPLEVETSIANEQMEEVENPVEKSLVSSKNIADEAVERVEEDKIVEVNRTLPDIPVSEDLQSTESAFSERNEEQGLESDLPDQETVESNTEESEENTSEHKEISTDNVSSVVQEMEEQTTQCDDNINDNVNENLENHEESAAKASIASIANMTVSIEETIKVVKSPQELTDDVVDRVETESQNVNIGNVEDKELQETESETQHTEVNEQVIEDPEVVEDQVHSDEIKEIEPQNDMEPDKEIITEVRDDEKESACQDAIAISENIAEISESASPQAATSELKESDPQNDIEITEDIEKNEIVELQQTESELEAREDVAIDSEVEPQKVDSIELQPLNDIEESPDTAEKVSAGETQSQTDIEKSGDVLAIAGVAEPQETDDQINESEIHIVSKSDGDIADTEDISPTAEIVEPQETDDMINESKTHTDSKSDVDSTENAEVVEPQETDDMINESKTHIDSKSDVDSTEKAEVGELQETDASNQDSKSDAEIGDNEEAKESLAVVAEVNTPEPENDVEMNQAVDTETLVEAQADEEESEDITENTAIATANEVKEPESQNAFEKNKDVAHIQPQATTDVTNLSHETEEDITEDVEINEPDSQCDLMADKNIVHDGVVTEPEKTCEIKESQDSQLVDNTVENAELGETPIPMEGTQVDVTDSQQNTTKDEELIETTSTIAEPRVLEAELHENESLNEPKENKSEHIETNETNKNVSLPKEVSKSGLLELGNGDSPNLINESLITNITEDAEAEETKDSAETEDINEHECIGENIAEVSVPITSDSEKVNPEFNKQVPENLQSPLESDKIQEESEPDLEKESIREEIPGKKLEPKPHSERKSIAELEFAPLQLSEDDSDDSETVPRLALEPDESNSPQLEEITEELPQSEEIDTKTVFVPPVVDTPDNLETILAVASLQNIDIPKQSDTDHIVSEKERREMEALAIAVQSITDNSNNHYEEYMEPIVDENMGSEPILSEESALDPVYQEESIIPESNQESNLFQEPDSVNSLQTSELDQDLNDQHEPISLQEDDSEVGSHHIDTKLKSDEPTIQKETSIIESEIGTTEPKLVTESQPQELVDELSPSAPNVDLELKNIDSTDTVDSRKEPEDVESAQESSTVQKKHDSALNQSENSNAECPVIETVSEELSASRDAEVELNSQKIQPMEESPAAQQENQNIEFEIPNTEPKPELGDEAQESVPKSITIQEADSEIESELTTTNQVIEPTQINSTVQEADSEIDPEVPILNESKREQEPSTIKESPIEEPTTTVQEANTTEEPSTTIQEADSGTETQDADSKSSERSESVVESEVTLVSKGETQPIQKKENAQKVEANVENEVEVESTNDIKVVEVNEHETIDKISSNSKEINEETPSEASKNSVGKIKENTSRIEEIPNSTNDVLKSTKENKTKLNDKSKKHKKADKYEELTINVDVPDKDRNYSPKITIKPIKVPDEEVSTTTSSDSELNKGSLKMTITKQSDNTHSILKISDHENSEDQSEQDEPIPKLKIKPKTQQVEQQHSPKMSTRSSKHLPASSNQRSSSPRITIKPVVKPDKQEPVSPLKIKINTKANSKVSGKEEEATRKVSIKPVVKAAEEIEVQSPRITIKPIPKPDTDKEVNPRLTIKPVKKPDEVTESEDKEVVSPKIIIKPVVKPLEIDVTPVLDDEEGVKERIVLKINKGNLPSPAKESKKREYPSDEDKSEKLAKITVKFSKEGGHPHIVQQQDEEVSTKRPHEELTATPEKNKKQKVEVETNISTRSRHKEQLADVIDKPQPALESKKHKDQSHEAPIETKRSRKDNLSDKSKLKDIDMEEVHVVECNSPIVISEDSRSQDSSVILLDDSKEDSMMSTDSRGKTPDSTKTNPKVVASGGESATPSPVPRRRGRPRKDAGNTLTVTDESRDDSLDRVRTPDSGKGTPKALLRGRESATPSPVPRKRGRPRKGYQTPVEVHEEVKLPEESPKTKESEGSPIPQAVESGRPKRSCRGGQSVCDTLGIKPRKSRGGGNPGGRGRGNKRGVANRSLDDRAHTSTKPALDEIKVEIERIKREEPSEESVSTSCSVLTEDPEDQAKSRLIKKTFLRKKTTVQPVIEIPLIETPLIETPLIETSLIETPLIEIDSGDSQLSEKEQEKAQEIDENVKNPNTKIEEPVQPIEIDDNKADVKVENPSDVQDAIEIVQDSNPSENLIDPESVDDKRAVLKSLEAAENLENQAKPETTSIDESKTVLIDDESKTVIIHDEPKTVIIDDECAKPFAILAPPATPKDFSGLDTSITSNPIADLPSSVDKSSNSEITSVSSTTVPAEVMIVDEETRMSAETNSRAQTPAKQVVTSADLVEESQSSVHSTATTESGKTPSRPNKAPRLEVQESDNQIITADLLTEYYWNGNGPFMLQEQVAQFLGIKSFKRKYPGIMRRMLDMQERDFIREKGLASEHMCDLGLTAVNSADILDIMYSDFQEKYEEYCKNQRDKQAKELINKQKALSLAVGLDKSKADITEQAVHSAAQWNARFNKQRKEQRRACMDLQNLTVHYPKGKMVAAVTCPHPGNYPVALVPGQFGEFYQEFTPTELNNLPINTMGYDEVTFIPREASEESGSESDSDSSSSGSSSTNSDSDSSSGVEDCKLCKHSPKKSSFGSASASAAPTASSAASVVTSGGSPPSHTPLIATLAK